MRRFQDPNFIPGADDIDGDGDPFAKYETEYGQIDGDSAPPAQFVAYQPGGAGQPWLRSPLPPWHLWGNTERQVIIPAGGGAVPLIATTVQLIKVSYKRPESWRWVFSAKLLEGPATTGVGQHVSVTVHWDLTIGVGRAAIQLPDFDVFSFAWDDGQAFPRDRQIWAMQTNSPGRTFVAPATSTVPGLLDSFSAQDVQLSARVIVQELGLPAPGNFQPVTVELSAQVSPSTHVRPDWYQEHQPPEVNFSGAEVGGS